MQCRSCWTVLAAGYELRVTKASDSKMCVCWQIDLLAVVSGSCDVLLAGWLWRRFCTRLVLWIEKQETKIARLAKEDIEQNKTKRLLKTTELESKYVCVR